MKYKRRPSGDHRGLSSHALSGEISVHGAVEALSNGTTARRPRSGSARTPGTNASQRPLGDSTPCQKLVPALSSSTRSGLSFAGVGPFAARAIGQSHSGTTSRVDFDTTSARPSGVHEVGISQAWALNVVSDRSVPDERVTDHERAVVALD